MRVSASAVAGFEEDGFLCQVRNTNAHAEDGYDDWHRFSAVSYHEYAKKLCEGYRFSQAKYALCVKEKRYIGISKEDFRQLKSDLLFLKNRLKTVLSSYNGYFEERFVKRSYSPVWPDGKKHARNVYAHSEAECEKLLAEMITEMKAEVTAENERLKAAPKAG